MGKVVTAYPPCDTSTLRMLPLAPRPVGLALILSIAQFRPEKDHDLQLRAFAKLLELQAQGPAACAHAPTHSCTRAPAVAAAPSTDSSLLGETDGPFPASDASSSLPSGHSSPFFCRDFSSESTSASRTTRRFSSPACSRAYASIAEETPATEPGETSPPGARAQRVSPPANTSSASSTFLQQQRPASPGPQGPGRRPSPADDSFPAAATCAPSSPEPPARLVLVLAGAVRHAADAARLAVLVATARFASLEI